MVIFVTRVEAFPFYLVTHAGQTFDMHHTWAPSRPFCKCHVLINAHLGTVPIIPRNMAVTLHLTNQVGFFFSFFLKGDLALIDQVHVAQLTTVWKGSAWRGSFKCHLLFGLDPNHTWVSFLKFFLNPWTSWVALSSSTEWVQTSSDSLRTCLELWWTAWTLWSPWLYCDDSCVSITPKNCAKLK